MTRRSTSSRPVTGVPWRARIRRAASSVVAGLAVAVTISIAAVAPIAAAQATTTTDTGATAPPDAHRLFLRGAAAYGDARYEEAVSLFEQAYAIAPEPTLLYNLALARERAGHVAAAIETYERFLVESPDAPERTEVERSIELLRRHRALEDEVARRAAARATAPVEPEPAPRASTEIGGWILAGVGGASVIAGGVAAGLAQSAYDAARLEETHLRSVALERDANDLGLVANVLFGVGGGLAFIGVVWAVAEASATPAAGTGNESDGGELEGDDDTTRGVEDEDEPARVEVRVGLGHGSLRVTF
jgi:tetratricopeptide (TPR) repeat protein